jgi:hypothetical protein
VSKVEIYEPAKHRALVEGWLRERGMPVPEPEMFPPFGVVVDGCVAGFLLCTDSKQCFIDQVVGDPSANPFVRKAAGQVLVACLEVFASERGYWVVSALGGNVATRRHLVERGFEPYAEFGLYIKRLSKCPS